MPTPQNSFTSMFAGGQKNRSFGLATRLVLQLADSCLVSPLRRFVSPVRSLRGVGCFLLFCLGSTALSHAAERASSIPPFVVAHWTTEEGLPQNGIKALAQTPDGYLWIGTLNGLARFDGIRCRIFNHETEIQFKKDAINDLAVDSVNGSLWIATKEGIVHCQERRFERFGLDCGIGEVGVLEPAANGGVWFGAGERIGRIQKGVIDWWELGESVDPERISASAERNTSTLQIQLASRLYQLDLKTRNLSRIDPIRQNGTSFSFLSDRNHALWVAGVHGLWRRSSTGWAQILSYNERTWPDFLFESSDGQIWVTIRSKDGLRNLYWWVEDGLVPFTAVGFPSDLHVTRMLQDREGSIWVGTAEGLFRLRPPSLRTWTRKNGLRDEDTGPSRKVRTARSGPGHPGEYG
ncbi:MAG: two-component regulator propeller domain-containing protein [Verrucomicrobiota bacterium]